MLKQLLLSRKIADKKRALEEMRKKRDEIQSRRTAMKKREEELESAVNEITEETEEEAKTAVEEAVGEFEQELQAIEQEETENGQAISDLEAAISDLQSELDEIARKVEDAVQEVQEAQEEPAAPAETNKERNVNVPMKRAMKSFSLRSYFGSAQAVTGFLARAEVKQYLTDVRDHMAQKRAISNAGLTIPIVMLDMLRAEAYRKSKLIDYVNLRSVGGKGRQNILGAIPEAVWTEMCANLNELALTFNQVEVDGFKVSGYLAICNAVLEDSDEALANEIIEALGTAIAKALDKAILFGSGTKMPVGIATRLAASSSPAWWGTNDPAFTDLHTSNIRKINKGSAAGTEFFIALIAELAIAKPKYTNEGLFWAMNRKTHLDIMAKALAFNSSAALVSNTDLMPVVGGDVVEFEDDELADYEIIGGFGGNYLLAERAGMEFAGSDIPLFLQDQTVFKGTARYDGKCLAGEAFVIVNYANTNPTTSKTFPEDYANTALNDLTITAAAHGSTSGKTVLTVSGTIAQSDPVLKYKLGDFAFRTGDALPSGFESLTSGSTGITAAAGKKITVVELDGNNRIVSAGVVVSVPKA